MKKRTTLARMRSLPLLTLLLIPLTGAAQDTHQLSGSRDLRGSIRGRQGCPDAEGC